jgi:CheY-like chemotaxis protein
MSGFEFLEACKHINCLEDQEVKIIILTSSAHQQDISRAKELGIKDYLLKPVSTEAILAAIQT